MDNIENIEIKKKDSSCFPDGVVGRQIQAVAVLMQCSECCNRTKRNSTTFGWAKRISLVKPVECGHGWHSSQTVVSFRGMKLFFNDDARKTIIMALWNSNKMFFWDSFQGYFYVQVPMGSNSGKYKHADIIT